MKYQAQLKLLSKHYEYSENLMQIKTVNTTELIMAYLVDTIPLSKCIKYGIHCIEH
jgi:hypothetical protein